MMSGVARVVEEAVTNTNIRERIRCVVKRALPGVDRRKANTQMAMGHNHGAR